MSHLVFARSNLLHHEQSQTYEAEAIAEVLQYDTATDEPETFGLVDGKQSVCHKRKVEHTAQREQRFLQSTMSHIIAGKYTADDKGSSTERTVAQSDFLLRQSQTLVGAVGLKEERHNLHYKSLGKAIEYDEEYIIYNVALAEEVNKHIAQLHHCLLESRAISRCIAVVGRHKLGVVQSQQHHDQAYYSHDYSPCHHRSLTFGYGSSCCIESADIARKVLDEHTCEHNESAGGSNLCNIIEGTLPSDVTSLILVRQRSHIHTVGSHVVSGTAQRYHSKQSNTNSEEVGQMQSQRHKSEDAARGYLSHDDKEFLGLVHFEERTPEGFQRPGEHDY